MKFVSKKITATILAFVFIFSGMFSLTVSADTTATRESCVVDHFSKLSKKVDGDGINDDYLPVSPNMYGTCTFVGMSMLLSFYDSYWRDDFVISVDNGKHELDWTQGEYNSYTDTLTRTFNSDIEAEAWMDHSDDGGTNYQFAIENKNKYLQSYLMGISRNTFLINEIALLDTQVKIVLEDYLYNTCKFTENQITVNIQFAAFDGDEAIFNTMKEQIENGNPVLFFGLNADLQPSQVDNDAMIEGGHCMVAYDVVTNHNGEEDILLHNGYNWVDTTDYVKSTEFKYVNSIIWLEINEDNLPHACTDNYLDTATNTTVCACHIYYNTHPAHASHNYQYDEYDSNYHWNECYCGEQGVKIDHALTYSNITSSYHREICIECDYRENVTHNYTEFVQTSSTHHNSICDCGYVRTNEAHSVGSYKKYTASKHYVHCKCGYLIGTYNHNMVTTGRYARCTDCGYLADTFSDIIIKGVEDGSELQNK